MQFGILLLLLAAHLTSEAQNNFERKDASGNTHNLSDLEESQGQNNFKWKDATGKTRSLSDLEEILRQHKQWIESDGKLGTQADLTGAHLSDADLSSADLSGANLHGAILGHAYLNGTFLSHAHLTGAHLVDANLSDAWLDDADLSDAHLNQAHLNGAHLNGAHLNGAFLNDADMRDADLGNADLGRAIFEPKSLPELRGIAAAKHLELLIHHGNPDALVQLRKQFEEDGFRDQERKITYALKRLEAELSCEKCTDEARAIVSSSDSTVANCGSFILNKVFFDWTCQYGMSPGRPLLLGLLLWFVCSLLYFVCLQQPGETGLYRVYEQRLGEATAAPRRFEKISISSIRRFRGQQGLLQFLLDEWLLLRASMFFSLMSAFNIGFRDINFGRWLRLLTRQEFDVKAVGWARVVAGWQSLISVYLIALWVLTYFGRPFG